MASKINNLFASSRFDLPEQRQAYFQFKEDQKVIPQTMIEEDELASFQYVIRDSGRPHFDYSDLVEAPPSETWRAAIWKRSEQFYQITG